MAPEAKWYLVVLAFDFALTSVQCQFASERKADLGQLGAISERKNHQAKLLSTLGYPTVINDRVL